VNHGNDRGLEGDVVVVSPHLDDAAFSLGAAIAKATRSGVTVRVLTVFAGDPDLSGPPGWWDRKAGFESEGAAARARRQEDVEACRILGARPEWLPFRDASYEPSEDDDEIREAVREAVGVADTVLVPGFPLHHVDHLRITRLLLDGRIPGARMGLYVEQPYAKWIGRRRPWHRPCLLPSLEPLVERPVAWTSIRAERRDRRAKYRASVAYVSQLPLFGRLKRQFLGRLLQRRIALYEALRGGEMVAWLE
jgi:LmbE family N-acetylglucosaminyl deacetylase